jgi:uncharacterized protein YndB with AHSA1/START domain
VPETSLTLTRVVTASRKRVFAALTTPALLRAWMGPSCIRADVDLQVGGAFRYGYRQRNGLVLWFMGRFDVVDAPQRLGYSWSINNNSQSRVTVDLVELDDASGPYRSDARCEVAVGHDHIISTAMRDGYARIWEVWLTGLAAWADVR